MNIELRAPHEDLTFMTPLSETHAERLVAFLAHDLRDGRVVDIGCGWGELLMRVVQAAPAATGLGVDLDGVSTAHGVRLAEQRALSGRLRFEVRDARDVDGPVAAAICIGASQVWGRPVEENQPMDYRSALRALRALLEPGSRLVYGEGIWSQPPTDAAVSPLAGRHDEFVTIAELLDIAVDEGFRPITVFEASQDEWDEFESGYSACYAHWLAGHPTDHPDATKVRELADRQRAGYYAGYRGVLGLAYLGLVAVA
ncbi:methyltransferase domain-containing protein [Luteipulveratus sp. YIM 133132]|uniref:SAM-dependent methyltransferase n=1 Tax=Luteipulveratus flavus TaxID=3031728 RepID=UPI0023AF2708|nr:methyltransferase domain-containing protein [Luteipulveratus sp. YIM 133132]MDE9365136.1 methyltransferase domain-containing protein [Luteipulveratus sp. YIM 133132]